MRAVACLQARGRAERGPSEEHRRVEGAARPLRQQGAAQAGQRDGAQVLPAVCRLHQNQPAPQARGLGGL